MNGTTFAAVMLAACAQATLWAADLTVERVAPADAIAVAEITGTRALIDRLRAVELIEEDDLDAFREGLRGALAEIPGEHAVPWRDIMKENDPLDVCTALSLGLAAWLDATEQDEPMLAVVAWIDLGAQVDQLGPALDESWESQRQSSSVSTEEVSGRAVDVVPLNLGPEDAMPAGLPRSVWHVRERRWVILATSREAMQRVLDVLDDREVEDTLADADAWQTLRGMLGEDDTMLAAAFVDPAFESARLFDPMGVAQMVRASFDAAIGPVRAIGVSAGAGQGESMLDWHGAVWMPEGPGGLLGLFADNTPVASLPGWVGLDTVSVSRFNVDYRSILPWIRSVIATNPMLMGMSQVVDEMESTMKSLLDPLGQRTLSARTLSRPLTEDSVSQATSIACGNSVALSDALAATAPKTGLEPREFQGHQVWALKEGGLGLPGMSEASFSLSVTPSGVFLGDDAGVEAALRGLGSRGGTLPAWLDRVREWLPDTDLAAWGGSDLAESLTAIAEVQRIRLRALEEKLSVEDPELWAEIRGELVDEEGQARADRLAGMASRLGPSAWWVRSDDDGFRLSGAVLSRPGE